MRLVVVGDCLLDVDIIGAAHRLSPDAPVPVVEELQQRRRPGGAGLAALLASYAGVDVTLVTSVAQDPDGQLLRAAIDPVPAVLGPAPDGSTSVKTRVRVDGQSLVRIDRGSACTQTEVTADMLAEVEAADAILIADYGRGLLRNEALRALLERRAADVPVVWDPHPRGPEPVAGVWLVTPNLAEAAERLGAESVHEFRIEPAAAELRQRWSARAVAITLGARGALVDDGRTASVLPAPQISVTDPCGAGDQFAVAAITALMEGQDVIPAAAFAVQRAAQFLLEGGVAGAAILQTPSSQRTPGAWTAAQDVCDRVRASGGTVVATGGCFDLLHSGHVRTLQAARALGDCLVVCLNSDRSVRQIKGPDRPINPERDRAEVLLSLGCVDAVAIFDEDDPAAVLQELQPHIWAKGGDYDLDSLPEVDVLRQWGGRVVLTPYYEGHSTTRLAIELAKVT